jgi:single-strand DNA-binding protein
MNSIQLIGHMTRDPELRQTATGKSVGNLRLAVDRRDREAAPVYVDVTVWNAQAETCAQHLAKGRQVGVTRRLDLRHRARRAGRPDAHAAGVDGPQGHPDDAALCRLLPQSR